MTQTNYNLKELREELNHIKNDLEYSEYNLCKDENRSKNIDPKTLESTCPEVTLAITIRELKRIINEL